MKTTKIVITFACLLITMSNLAQTKFFGGKTEITVNNPTYEDEDTKITNSAIFKIGGLAGMKKDNIDLGFETGILIGFERLIWEDKYEGTWYNTMDASNTTLEIPFTMKKGFAIPNSPVKPLLSAGVYLKIPLNYKEIEEVKSYHREFGLNAGVGVTLFSYVELGVVYRAILGDTWGVGRWIDPSNQQKSQIIVSAAVVINK